MPKMNNNNTESNHVGINKTSKVNATLTTEGKHECNKVLPKRKNNSKNENCNSKHARAASSPTSDYREQNIQDTGNRDSIKVLQSLKKPSVTLPKKRKYLTNFVVESSNTGDISDVEHKTTFKNEKNEEERRNDVSKKDNVENNLYLNTANTSQEITQESFRKEESFELSGENIPTSTPVPKKRGRKKKSEQPPPLIKEEIIELDESKSGRKRKKINYTEFANPYSDDDEPIKKYRVTKQKTDSPKEYLPQKNNTKNNVEINTSRSNTANESEVNDADENPNDNDFSDTDNVNNSKNKRGKYKKTGETVVMVNSIFAAAFGDRTQNGTELSATDRNGSEVSVNIVDESNMVNCVGCNKKISNDEWDTHNNLEHYNLAWREGEDEILLDNENTVSKILKPILKEKKILNCKKCKVPFKEVKPFIHHMEKCNGILSNGMVKCARCNKEIEKSKWPNHKLRQHNNLAWRIGDPPLNLNDQQLVMKILTALYKAKKPLHCEKCDASKKSVVGFLSHQAQCGLDVEDAKVQCKFCDKKVLPVSMQTHIKLVHGTPKEKPYSSDVNYFEVDTDRNSKRKAAEMALQVINEFSKGKVVQEHSKYYLKQLNFAEEEFMKPFLKKELSNDNTVKCKFSDCSFETDSISAIIEHMDSCGSKPEQYYTCKRCLTITNSEEEIKEHLKSIHDIAVIEDEFQASGNENEEDEDEKWEQCQKQLKKESLNQKLKMEHDPSYRVKPTCILNLKKNPNQLFSEAFNYTMSFCEQQYLQNRLFDNLRHRKGDWQVLGYEAIENYLPRNGYSCLVARKKVKRFEKIFNDDYEFKTFEIFEVEQNEGTATIFCGGPVQATAWMPTPHNNLNCPQILAVATLNDFDSKYHTNQQYRDKSVIQFWHFGALANKQQIPEPKPLFFLAFDYGPVWHLEWCPSGCFDAEFDQDEIRRLGILAVAGSDTAVYLYSVPDVKEEEMGLIYTIKPVAVLLVAAGDESLTGEPFFGCKISWSKVSGHKYIAVGYTDGVVALFNLDARLLTTKYEDCEALTPFKIFQPHTHMITVLDFPPLGDGKRWLVTGSFDRNLIVWDLSNNTKVTSKRKILSDGLWLPNWLSIVTGTDESSTTSGINCTLSSYRDYLFERVNLPATVSTVKSVSVTGWLNGIMYCSSVGETFAMFPSQLLCGLDTDKKFKSYTYLFGRTKLINKQPNVKEKEASEKKITNKNSDASSQGKKYEPFTYKEVKEKYGLVFCDMEMDNHKNFLEKNCKNNFSNMEESKANLYSLQAINKVAFNPNRQASLYYATGYQAGFVRITYMKFLENDRQIK